MKHLRNAENVADILFQDVQAHFIEINKIRQDEEIEEKLQQIHELQVNIEQLTAELRSKQHQKDNKTPSDANVKSQIFIISMLQNYCFHREESVIVTSVLLFRVTKIRSLFYFFMIVDFACVFAEDNGGGVNRKISRTWE